MVWFNGFPGSIRGKLILVHHHGRVKGSIARQQCGAFESGAGWMDRRANTGRNQYTTAGGGLTGGRDDVFRIVQPDGTVEAEWDTPGHTSHNEYMARA